MMDIYTRGVYFLSDSSTFSYTATCLADGLDQLGIPIFANISYADPLITDFGFKKCTEPGIRKHVYCIVLDLQDTRQYYHQLVRFEAPHERTIVMCMQDDAGAFCSGGVSASLCAHENSFRKLAGNRIPIGFGLSSAMINKSIGVSRHMHRTDGFLCSFRPSLNQHLRAALELVLLPVLQQHIPVQHRHTTAGRWNDDYYDLLRGSLGCLAYGGAFEQDFSKNEYMLQNDHFRAFMSCVEQQRETVILRWDSWRFWESLVFGCVTMHLDFEMYGFKLPVMPENWKQYVGINLANVRHDVERLVDERELMSEIAWNGRQWAIEHYSPLAVGRRFMVLLQKQFC
jgi:hypothetical protein